MAIKKYGIYLAYPPTVDMRSEGLGRYLAAFLKAAQNRDDLQFVIACPSWSKETIAQLFLAEGIDERCFEFITLPAKPALLKLYEWQKWLFSRRHIARARRMLAPLKRRVNQSNSQGRLLQLVTDICSPLLGLRIPIFGYIVLLCFVPLLLGLGALALFFTAVGAFLLALYVMLRNVVLTIKMPPMGLRLIRQLQQMQRMPQKNTLTFWLYTFMAIDETRRLVRRVNKRTDISAWYCPTAFWPEFNRIRAPKLTCVPDVVLTEFPVGFALTGGARQGITLKQVEETIKHGQHFITYSETTKYETLVKRYHIRPEHIDVVKHAPNDMGDVINITGFPDIEAARRDYCQRFLRTALSKARVQDRSYLDTFANMEMKFFFYASQFRPNKNIMTLLRAYEHTLHKRYVGHKLLLTGHPSIMAEVEAFIELHHLENEVLFLHRMTTHELAACYALADIVINPSLSEGGCPFTFAEALSVGTPTLMARIPVTTESLDQPELAPMYFDPYSAADLAARMEWAVNHRAELLAVQLPVYEQLKKRTWQNVVSEHLAILDRIASPLDSLANQP